MMIIDEDYLNIRRRISLGRLAASGTDCKSRQPYQEDARQSSSSVISSVTKTKMLTWDFFFNTSERRFVTEGPLRGTSWRAARLLTRTTFLVARD
jgi:hypothetical protein